MLIIPNESMPKDCMNCPCIDKSEEENRIYYCELTGKQFYERDAKYGKRQSDCPLIEVKLP